MALAQFSGVVSCFIDNFLGRCPAVPKKLSQARKKVDRYTSRKVNKI